jgi:hypothetical protein
MRRSLAALLFVVFQLPVAVFHLPASAGEPGSGARAFAQLGQELPTPNTYRTASGAPGHDYWQQQADYTIDARLDESPAPAHRKCHDRLHQQLSGYACGTCGCNSTRTGSAPIPWTDARARCLRIG